MDPLPGIMFIDQRTVKIHAQQRLRKLLSNGTGAVKWTTGRQNKNTALLCKIPDCSQIPLRNLMISCEQCVVSVTHDNSMLKL